MAMDSPARNLDVCTRGRRSFLAPASNLCRGGQWLCRASFHNGFCWQRSNCRSNTDCIHLEILRLDGQPSQTWVTTDRHRPIDTVPGNRNKTSSAATFYCSISFTRPWQDASERASMSPVVYAASDGSPNGPISLHHRAREER